MKIGVEEKLFVTCSLCNCTELSHTFEHHECVAFLTSVASFLKHQKLSIMQICMKIKRFNENKNKKKKLDGSVSDKVT